MAGKNNKREVSEEVRDLTKVLNKSHEDKWVALSSDRTKVVGYSEDLMSLKNKVGTKNVVYVKVPLSGRTYAF